MLEVTPAERTKLLKRLAEALPTTKAPHAPPARRSDPVAALEAQLLPTLGGGPEELRALAADRAARARAAFQGDRPGAPLPRAGRGAGGEAARARVYFTVR